MKKDYKKLLKDIYNPKPSKPVIVTVPETNYLMVSGNGHPQDESFQLAAQTLFPVAYISKFILKERNPAEDFVVMPMEVKWRLNRNEHGSKRYNWTMMIMQPQCITKEIIAEAEALLIKKKKEIPLKERLRLQSFNEGLSGQILHIGPYLEPMEQSFAILKEHLADLGYEWEPDSHDVYFNDIRNTPAEKLKTLIRVRIWPQDDTKPQLADPFVLWE